VRAMRKLLVRLLPVIIPLVVVIGPGLRVVLRRDWQIERIQQVAQIELARALNRQVNLGSLDTDFLGRAVVHGIEIFDTPGQPLLNADSVEIRFNLRSVLTGETSPLRSISAVYIRQPEFWLRRDKKGRLNIQDLLKKKGAPSKSRFAGHVVIENARLHFRDESGAFSRLSPLEFTLDNVTATVDLRDPAFVKVEFDGANPQGYFANLYGQVHAGAKGDFAAAKVALFGLSLDRLTPILPRFAQVKPVGGTIDVAGQLYRLAGREQGGNPEIGWRSAVDLHNIRARVGALGNMPVGLDGRIIVANESAVLEDVKIQLPAARLATSGSVFDLKKPRLDLKVTGDVLDMSLIQTLLSTRAKLPPLRTQGTAHLDAQIVGELAHPNVKGSISLDGLELPYPPGGTILLSQVSAEGTVLDLAAPRVAASVQVGRAEVSPFALRLIDSEKTPPPSPYVPSELQLAPIEGLSTTVAGSLDGGCAQGNLRLPQVTVGAYRLTDVALDWELVAKKTEKGFNSTVAVNHGAAGILGGTVSFGGLATVSGDDIEYWARANGEGLDLTALAAIDPALEHNLAGTVSLKLEAAGSGTEPASLDAVASIHMADGRFQNVAFRSADAGLRLDHGVLHIEPAVIEDKRGKVVAKGTVELFASDKTDKDNGSRKVALDIAASDIDLGRLAADFGREDVSGTGFAKLNISGTFAETAINTQVDVTGAAYKDRKLGSVRVRGDVHVVDTSRDLPAIGFASAGTATVPKVVVIRSLGLFSEPAQVTVSGKITNININDRNATLQLDASAVASTTELLAMLGTDAPVSGVARLEPTKIGGTLQNPAAFGKVTLEAGIIQDYPVETAEVPFALHDGTLMVQQEQPAVLRWRDATVTAWATVEPLQLGLGPPGTPRASEPAAGPIIAGGFRAEGINLAALPMGTDGQLVLDGVAAVEDGGIFGPLNQPEVTCVLNAPEVIINGQQVRNVEGDIRYSNGKLILEEFTASADTAVIVAHGTFDPAQGTLELAGGIDDLSAKTAISAALPAIEKSSRDALRKLRARIAARVSTNFDINGRLGTAEPGESGRSAPSAKMPRLRGAVDLAVTDVSLDRQPLPGIAASARFEGRRAYLKDAHFLKDEAQLTASGSFEPQGPIEGIVSLKGLDLSRLRAWLPANLQLGGTANIWVKAAGTAEAPVVQTAIRVDSPSVYGVDFGNLTAGEPMRGGHPLAPEETFKPDDEIAGGITWADSKLTLGNGPRALTLSRDGQKLVFEGYIELPSRSNHEQSIRDARLNLSATLAETDLSHFPRLIAQLAPAVAARGVPELGGHGAGVVTVTGTIRRPAIAANVRLSDASCILPGGTVQLMRINGALQLRRDAPEARGAPTYSLVMGSPGTDTPITLDLQAFRAETQPPASKATVETPKAPPEKPLAEATQAKLGDVIHVSAIGAAKIVTTDLEHFGENRFDNIRVTARGGTPAIKNLFGAVNLQTELQLNTDKQGAHKLKVAKLIAEFGGGKVEAGGTIGLSRFKPQELQYNDFDIWVATEKKPRIKVGRFVDATVGATLMCNTPAKGQPASLDGEVVLTDTRLSIPPIGRPKKKKEFKLYSLPITVPAFELNLVLRTGKDVAFQWGNVAHLPFTPGVEAVKVVGTPQKPYVVANVQAKGGTVVLPGSVMRLQSAEVTANISPEPGATPKDNGSLPLQFQGHVSGQARTNISGYTITMQFDFPIMRPPAPGAPAPVVVSSDPPLPEGQIYAMLGHMDTFKALAKGENVSAAFQKEAMAALASGVHAALLMSVEEKLIEALGLTELSINYSFDQSMSLRIGKYVIKDLLVTYQRNLDETNPQFDFKMAYVVKSNFAVSVSTNERENNAFSIEWKKRF